MPTAECRLPNAADEGMLPKYRLPTSRSVERLPRMLGQVYSICRAPLYQEPEAAMAAIIKLLNCEETRPSCPSCGCPVLPADDPEHCAGCGGRV
jgi:hypothetical protein